MNPSASISSLFLLVLFPLLALSMGVDEGNGTTPGQNESRPPSGRSVAPGRPKAPRSGRQTLRRGNQKRSEAKKSEGLKQLQKVLSKFKTGSFDERLEAMKALMELANTGLENEVKGQMLKIVSEGPSRSQLMAMQMINELKIPTRNGTWMTNCMSSEESSYKKRVSIRGSRMTVVKLEYAKPNCKFEPKRQTETYQFKIEPASHHFYSHKITYFNKDGSAVHSELVGRDEKHDGLIFSSADEVFFRK